MNRRKFVYTSCGFMTTLVSPGLWNILNPVYEKKKFDIVPYKSENRDLDVPIFKVTPDDGNYNYTYYDIPTHSPSNRFIAVTKVPFLQDRYPEYGELADVCVVDLEKETIETVYRTKSWGFQTGALLHWGSDDRYLYTNDVLNGDEAVCVRIDLLTGKYTAYSGLMYNIAPNGTFVVGFPLELLNITQQGYGIPSKDPHNPESLPYGAAKDQGMWKTDLESNHKSLLVSLADLAERVPEPPPEKNGTYYLWHTKVNPQSSRILQISRCLFPGGRGGRNAMVYTCRTDGSDIQPTLHKDVWGRPGGHPNWHPDGLHIIRVMSPEGIDQPHRYCQFLYDGSDFKILSHKLNAGGHPRITPDSRHLTTDDYPIEHGQQKVRIKLIDLAAEEELILAKMNSSPKKDLTNRALRLDGHGTWDRHYKKLAFQAAPEGKRQIFVADLSGVV